MRMCRRNVRYITSKRSSRILRMSGKKTLAILTLTGVLVFGNLSAAYARVKAPGYMLTGTWCMDASGWWYRYPNFDYAKNKWEHINGYWYHFGPTGYMDTGWYTENGKSYYLDPNYGAMYENCQLIIDGYTYDFDDSGAATKANNYKSPVVIPPEDQKSDLEKQLDMMCDEILSGLVYDGMSDRQKLTNIYYWIRHNLSYNGHSATRDWVTEAFEGLRKRHGDCYTYFSVAQALLTRAGYPSIEVIRSTDNDHFWNLTRCDGQWYHFDTTPRAAGGTFCLLTDAEMLSYSMAHRGCFTFDRSLYPPTP